MGLPLMSPRAPGFGGGAGGGGGGRVVLGMEAWSGDSVGDGSGDVVGAGGAGVGGGGGGGGDSVEREDIVVVGGVSDRAFLLEWLALSDATAVLATVDNSSTIELPTAASTISLLPCGTTLNTIATMEHPMATSEMARMSALTHVQRGEPEIMKLMGRLRGSGRESGVMLPRSASGMVASGFGKPLVVDRRGESGGESRRGMAKALEIPAEKFCRWLDVEVDEEDCETGRGLVESLEGLRWLMLFV